MYKDNDIFTIHVYIFNVYCTRSLTNQIYNNIRIMQIAFSRVLFI